MEEIKVNISTNSLTIVYFFICITTGGFLLMILVDGLKNLLFKDKQMWKAKLKNLEFLIESEEKLILEKTKEETRKFENDFRIAKGEFEIKLSELERIFILIAKLNNVTKGFTYIPYHDNEIYLEQLDNEGIELLVDKSYKVLNHYYEIEYDKYLKDNGSDLLIKSI